MTETSAEYVDRIAKEYGLYILDHRAIPTLFDGMKTSQRIALWLMRNKPGKIKTMALAGEMIASELYVHGDKAGADTISLIAAKFKNNYPLLDGIGGFGSKAEPGAIGQPRYTYVKRNKFAEAHLYVDMSILPMVENHDGSNRMPGVFLPLVPLVLLNGVKGMATGWSTNILPRRYADVKKAVIEVIKAGKCKTKLEPFYEGYDIDVVDHGQGRYTLSGRATVKNTSTVIVSELPPEVTLEQYRDILSGMEIEGKIAGFTDRSKKAVNIEIKFQRVVLAKLQGDKLIEYLSLRTPGRASTERLVVIGANGVRQYDTAEELVEDWVKWRLSWYERRFEYLRDKAEVEELFWKSFIACYEGTASFEGIPMRLGEVKNRASLKVFMHNAIQGNDLPVDDSIVERLMNLPIYRWTQEENEKAKREVVSERELVEKYEAARKDQTIHKDTFKSDLLALKV